MRRLWHDFQVHKWAAALFLVYWLTTLAVVYLAWHEGIPYPVLVLLLTIPLIAGALVGWWRTSTREGTARSRGQITGGMLVGVLSAEITFLVKRNGVIEEVIVWMKGGGQRFGEMLVWCLIAGILGALLGLAGAGFAMILNRVRG